MMTRPFPLEKIFGSRTRVKVITLFTTGVKRPYYVREIARNVNERLNAVRRELEILRKIGMLTTYDNKRRKYYELNPEFMLVGELGSIMQKAGPGVEDLLFKNLERLGDVRYACVSGYFTGAKESPTDVLLIGSINEQRLTAFVERVERQLNREITYTPMTENEYKYRRNFNDMFLRTIFLNPHKVLINKLDQNLQPQTTVNKEPAVIRTKTAS
ncbi:MAG: winged helix-turn-helix domain-containing protein [Candidatus Andersenbacteria bacterium]